MALKGGLGDDCVCISSTIKLICVVSVAVAWILLMLPLHLCIFCLLFMVKRSLRQHIEVTSNNLMVVTKLGS